MIPSIWSLPFLACSRAFVIISVVTPEILISIWNPVIPFSVPATLKSISPKWSSSPRISLRITVFSPSEIRPIAIPATGFFIGTPQSRSDSVPLQTEAIEEEPFDSSISDTILVV